MPTAYCTTTTNNNVKGSRRRRLSSPCYMYVFFSNIFLYSLNVYLKQAMRTATTITTTTTHYDDGQLRLP